MNQSWTKSAIKDPREAGVGLNHYGSEAELFITCGQSMI